MTTPTSNTLPLADIHLQAAPGLWPLAWGWWAVLAVLLVIAIAAIVALRQHRQKRFAQQQAIKQLSDASSLAEVNALLKRAALTYFPRHDVAKLTGHAWLAFLDNQRGPSNQAFLPHEALWQKGAFSQKGLSDEELDLCKALAKNWLKDALPPKHSTATRNHAHGEVKDV
ncbi:DUF4381 domain-containing protein [Enterovibrio nigricans]|uniref:DUF4381 domain-containing protein n=1 Tax=Enterovibrio nigricans DSM 22720 TaxID=1121868 RepID=A0A1T4UMP1_9GAMM|nr:DUF4381 domain-containing protein [Enterovibrio nigricans]PKF49587.1 DUF4381 domain-containing protein [Enterovibrio nigricans]SKA53935.1 protein of unknown function [Enterovibrio nigricans DSM 22720]